MAFKKIIAVSQYYFFMFIMLIIKLLNSLVDKAVKFTPNITPAEIIYFDFETTGLNPYHEKIIDYAFLVEEEESGDTYIEGLVNPQKKFEKKITDITGIHPDELEDKPLIRHELEKIYNFINYNYKQICYKHIPKRFLVAHNCDGFDKVFLMSNFTDKTRFPLTKNWFFIDTLPLAKKLLPKLSSHSLKALALAYNVKPGTHRALSDTVTLRKVFNSLIKQLSYHTKVPMSVYMENPQLIIDFYSFD